MTRDHTGTSLFNLAAIYDRFASGIRGWVSRVKDNQSIDRGTGRSGYAGTPQYAGRLSRTRGFAP